MKNIFISLCGLIFTQPCIAGLSVTTNNSSDNVNSLQNEIQRLEEQLAQKKEKLHKCAAKNENFKIAGVATVGLAGAGVITNVSLYSKTKKQVKQADAMNGNIDSDLKAVEKAAPEFKKLMEECTLSAEAEKKLIEEFDMTLIKNIYTKCNKPDNCYSNLSDSEIQLILRFQQKHADACRSQKNNTQNNE